MMAIEGKSGGLIHKVSQLASFKGTAEHL